MDVQLLDLRLALLERGLGRAAVAVLLHGTVVLWAEALAQRFTLPSPGVEPHAGGDDRRDDDDNSNDHSRTHNHLLAGYTPYLKHWPCRRCRHTWMLRTEV